MQQYGYSGYYKPPRTTKPSQLSLAASGGHAAATPVDPFGLLTDTTDSARVARANATPHVPARTVVAPQYGSGASETGGGNGLGGTDVGVPPGYPGATGQHVTAPAPGPKPYDIHTDPALQEVDALIGMNDDQARAAALKQKELRLLEHGDPTLAAAVLGPNDPYVQAAGANPSSTLAHLKTQREHNVHDLTEQLNKDNLLYSGNRIVREGQAGQDYQDALAQAAAGTNADIGSIDSSLAAALAGNQQQHVSALLDAYGRHKEDPGAAAAAPGPDPNQPPPDIGPPPQDPSSGFGAFPATFLDANNPNIDRLALALATANRGRGGVGY